MENCVLVDCTFDYTAIAKQHAIFFFYFQQDKPSESSYLTQTCIKKTRRFASFDLLYKNSIICGKTALWADSYICDHTLKKEKSHENMEAVSPKILSQIHF